MGAAGDVLDDEPAKGDFDQVLDRLGEPDDAAQGALEFLD